jgi:hypothetical protein
MTENIVNSDNIYERYTELFRHYSNILFKARITVITVILALFANIFEIVGAKPPNDVSRSLISLFAASFIVLISSMESRYSERLKEVADEIKKLEQDSDSPRYFSGYGKPSHWHILLVYFLSIGVLCFNAIFRGEFGAGWIITSPIPLIFFVYINWNLIKLTRPYTWLVKTFRKPPETEEENNI